MEKYLIWDTIINKPVVEATIEDYINVNFKDRCKAYKDIGLKDLNGKNIYADSSIVEYGIQKWKVIYNVFQMSYELECVSNKSLSNMRLTGEYKNQLKIIDTIQENKLGLIK